MLGQVNLGDLVVVSATASISSCAGGRLGIEIARDGLLDEGQATCSLRCRSEQHREQIDDTGEQLAFPIGS